MKARKQVINFWASSIICLILTSQMLSLFTEFSFNLLIKVFFLNVTFFDAASTLTGIDFGEKISSSLRFSYILRSLLKTTLIKVVLWIITTHCRLTICVPFPSKVVYYCTIFTDKYNKIYRRTGFSSIHGR